MAETYLGLDFGTGGVRACVIAPGGEIEALERLDFVPLAPHELAPAWADALLQVIAAIPRGLRRQLAAIALDGTSGSVLACDPELTPLHPPLLYNDARAGAEASLIAQAAGAEHIAANPASGLAKMLWLKSRLNPGQPAQYLHQADWLSALLSGRHGVSDYHNALKSGYPPGAPVWPDWISRLLGHDGQLPKVVPPGAAIGQLRRDRALELGISGDCLIRSGTTDSIAAFLAADVRLPGEAVTSLGTTLVLKQLSPRPVHSTAQGVYSHWFGRLWLAGGASNSGGGVLAQYFTPGELAGLSREIDPNRPSGLDYYPLSRAGERFPINDPQLAPRLEPRPDNPTHFLHGLLEGIAGIEARGYRLLAELGAGPLRRVLSTGGGAANECFRLIRQRRLEVPVQRAGAEEAAYGAARLARDGTQLFPGADHA